MTIESHHIIVALLRSDRWLDIVKELDVIKVADVPALYFEILNEDEKQEVIDWAENKIDSTPEIIADHFRKCEHKLHEMD